MKRTEIIELNGVEYTLELNRESFIQIDKICNIQKTMQVLKTNLYEYVDEIDDDYVPFEENYDSDDFANKVKEKEKMIYNFIERSFFIWMYPNHKLKISQVREILKPYLEDENKTEWLVNNLIKYLEGCVSLKEENNNPKN